VLVGGDFVGQSSADLQQATSFFRKKEMLQFHMLIHVLDGGILGELIKKFYLIEKFFHCGLSYCLDNVHVLGSQEV
jgi:hypothetical protein